VRDIPERRQRQPFVFPLYVELFGYSSGFESTEINGFGIGDLRAKRTNVALILISVDSKSLS
jgi:hypothetical protein